MKEKEKNECHSQVWYGMELRAENIRVCVSLCLFVLILFIYCCHWLSIVTYVPLDFAIFSVHRRIECDAKLFGSIIQCVHTCMHGCMHVYFAILILWEHFCLLVRLSEHISNVSVSHHKRFCPMPIACTRTIPCKSLRLHKNVISHQVSVLRNWNVNW